MTVGIKLEHTVRGFFQRIRIEIHGADFLNGHSGRDFLCLFLFRFGQCGQRRVNCLFFFHCIAFLMLHSFGFTVIVPKHRRKDNGNGKRKEMRRIPKNGYKAQNRHNRPNNGPKKIDFFHIVIRLKVQTENRPCNRSFRK